MDVRGKALDMYVMSIVSGVMFLAGFMVGCIFPRNAIHPVAAGLWWAFTGAGCCLIGFRKDSAWWDGKGL